MWTFNRDRLIGDNLLQLRNNPDITVPFAHIDKTKKMPLTNLPTVWNNFNENELKNIKCKKQFDKKLKKFFIDDLSDTITCNRLYCPACSMPDN